MSLCLPFGCWFKRMVYWSLLFLAAVGLATPPARAGLAINLDMSRITANGTNYYYLIGCSLSTNFSLPLAPFGSYTIGSPGYPGNYGTGDSYTFDTNGFNLQGGFSTFYGDFNSAMQGLTNGLWTIAVTAPGTTNITTYQFNVLTPGLTTSARSTSGVSSRLGVWASAGRVVRPRRSDTKNARTPSRLTPVSANPA